MRIALADDDLSEVQLIRRVLDLVPGYRIAWVSQSEAETIEKCAGDRPDLILLKLSARVLDAARITRVIMQQSPCPVLLLTHPLSQQWDKVFEAMGQGALDAARVPELHEDGGISGGEELLRKIAIIGRLIGKKEGRIPFAERRSALTKREVSPLIALGASTGGPKALAHIFSQLPSNLGACFVVVQHVDTQFVKGLAEWLDGQTPLKVVIAQEGDVPQLNRVLLAGGEDHLILGPDGRFHYTPEPRDYPFRPSVDSLFQSLRRHWQRHDVAVLLTGMGKDGAKGLKGLREAGWHTIVQDEETSTVYGMPKAALSCGAAVEVLPLARIPGAIMARVQMEKK
ncbi:MAG: chemotaxis-specific protein-glutamate methyltransferase CheB [Acidobacteriota bacterium]